MKNSSKRRESAILKFGKRWKPAAEAGIPQGQVKFGHFLLCVQLERNVKLVERWIEPRALKGKAQGVVEEIIFRRQNGKLGNLFAGDDRTSKTAKENESGDYYDCRRVYGLQTSGFQLIQVEHSCSDFSRPDDSTVCLSIRFS